MEMLRNVDELMAALDKMERVREEMTAAYYIRERTENPDLKAQAKIACREAEMCYCDMEGALTRIDNAIHELYSYDTHDFDFATSHFAGVRDTIRELCRARRWRWEDVLRLAEEKIKKDEEQEARKNA